MNVGSKHDFPGLSLGAVHWLADNDCTTILGVKAISPALEGGTNFQAHNALWRMRHYTCRRIGQSRASCWERQIPLYRLSVED